MAPFTMHPPARILVPGTVTGIGRPMHWRFARRSPAAAGSHLCRVTESGRARSAPRHLAIISAEGARCLPAIRTEPIPAGADRIFQPEDS
jgi:hypothetical protein